MPATGLAPCHGAHGTQVLQYQTSLFLKNLWQDWQQGYCMLLLVQFLVIKVHWVSSRVNEECYVRERKTQQQAKVVKIGGDH
jgi:hypothetical protein